MRILVDAVLFQLLPPGSAEAQACARVLRELVAVAEAREVVVTLLDRGRMPPLGPVEAIGFPTFHAADAVADAMLLQRMGEWVRADAVVSTALTAALALPAVQLVVCEDASALTPGREAATELAECEIALACASALVCLSPASEDAVRSRFPDRRPRVWGRPTAGVDGRSPDRWAAEAVVDAAALAVSTRGSPEVADRLLALRRVQAGLELSNG